VTELGPHHGHVLERADRRRVRLAGRLCLLAGAVAACGVVACASLLEIPEDPQLVEQSGATPLAPRDEPDRGGAPPGPSDGDSIDEPRPPPPLETAPAAMERAEPSTTPPQIQAVLADAGSSPPVVVPTQEDAAVPAICGPARSLGPDGHCYATLAELSPWPEARRNCQALGAGWDLASLRSAAENQFATELAGADVWIGASDLGMDGTWVWVDDGSVFWQGDALGAPVAGAFANWNSTEPNGRGGSGCARLVAALAGSWADLECEMQRGALCEGPAPLPPSD